MNKPVKPIVLSSDGSRHEPMAQGEVFPVDSIPISTSKRNLLEMDSTGVLLTGDMIVSSLERNPVEVGVDGKLYMKLKNMISPDDKLLKVADNIMWAELSMVFDAAASKLSLVGKDHVVLSSVELPIAPGLPTVVEILQDVIPPKPEGFVENPYKQSTYLHMRFRTADKPVDIYLDMAKLVDVYTGGAGIVVENNVVSLKVKDGGGLIMVDCCDDPACACPALPAVDMPAVARGIVDEADKIIAVNTAGKLVSRLKLGVRDNVVELLGRQNEVISSITLPEAELPEIPGLPTKAEFVTNPDGYAPGTYLHLEFTLADGTVKQLYLDVTALSDVYTAGNGIAIASNRTVSVRAEADKGITVGRLGVGVNTTEIVAQADSVLSVEDNKVHATVGLAQQGEKLVLTGAGGQSVSSVQLPLHNGIPTVIELLDNFIPPPAHGSGATLPKSLYLHFHYDRLDGGESDIYVDLGAVKPAVSDTGGGGITVDPDGKLKLELDPDSALAVTPDGKLTIDQTKLAIGVSSDAGNNLSEGTDGKPFYPSKLGTV